MKTWVVSSLKVSYFQNEIMKSSFLPKYERKTVRISALSCVVRAEIMTIFCSHFGRHDDFIIHSEINWPLGCGNYSREETIHGYTVSSYLCMERQIVHTELGPIQNCRCRSPDLLLFYDVIKVSQYTYDVTVLMYDVSFRKGSYPKI